VDECEHLLFNLRPVRLQEIVDQRLSLRLTDVQAADGQVEAGLGDGDSCLGFDHRVPFVMPDEDRVETYRRCVGGSAVCGRINGCTGLAVMSLWRFAAGR
jgi:hypothetical protein